MSDTAILVEGVGKQYRIGASPQRYKALRDSISDAVAKPFRAMRSLVSGKGSGSADDAETLIWALKDVSFEVKRGEVVGVIGRNGAGKSTLLKVLSRITEPTEGQVEIRGRVGSLLEVGTGFHPELTGRENIFMNGAILGMKKAEIARKFDEMVAFAEVEKFIDTPVKHYSSGMYLRLAFAVAAHLEPEILIVDEVLAVGDAAFQKKCVGKMGDVAREGRTVVFVSHQMNQIRRLCGTCVWLEDGSVKQSGTSGEMVSRYESSSMLRTASERSVKTRGLKSHFVSWAAEGADSQEMTTLDHDEALTFKFRFHAAKPIIGGHHGIALFNNDGLLIWAYAFDNIELNPGDHELRYTFPGLPIRPGAYNWQLSFYDQNGLLDLWEALPPLHIHTPLKTHQSDGWQGVLNLSFSMSVGLAATPVEQLI